MPTSEQSPAPSKEVNFRLDLSALEILERFAPKKSHTKGPSAGTQGHYPGNRAGT